MREAGGGSRFLYDSFDAAAARIEANERVAQERWAALEFRWARSMQRWNGWKSASGWGSTGWPAFCWRRWPRP